MALVRVFYRLTCTRSPQSPALDFLLKFLCSLVFRGLLLFLVHAYLLSFFVAYGDLVAMKAFEPTVRSRGKFRRAEMDGMGWNGVNECE